MTEMRNKIQKKILKNALFHITIPMNIYIDLKNKYSCQKLAVDIDGKNRKSAIVCE